MDKQVKTIVWIGTTRKEIQSFPAPVRRDIGQALYTAQQNRTDPAAKPMKGFRGSQVMEIVDRYNTDAYRAVYTTQFGEVLYVLHTFQKKSKRGISTPKKEIGVIREHLIEAKLDYQERKEKENA